MYNYFTPQSQWLAWTLLIGICLFTLLILTKQKSFPSIFKNLIPRLLAAKAAEAPHYFNEIIDFPREETESREQSEISPGQESPEDDLMEMVVGAESALLQEADAVVNKIEEVITSSATSPSGMEEMYGKIKSIVSSYSLFQNTEYFEAINNFIRIMVSRECNLKWSEVELHGLWG